MERVRVESSVLASVAYDAQTQVLEAEFLSGKRYRYGGVPAQIYRQLLDAASVGTFFNLNIRSHYPFLAIPRPA